MHGGNTHRKACHHVNTYLLYQFTLSIPSFFMLKGQNSCQTLYKKNLAIQTHETCSGAFNNMNGNINTFCSTTLNIDFPCRDINFFFLITYLDWIQPKVCGAKGKTHTAAVTVMLIGDFLHRPSKCLVMTARLQWHTIDTANLSTIFNNRILQRGCCGLFVPGIIYIVQYFRA